jgi:ATP-dependent exoDNAse (exonuclease V) alpha subunit
MDRQLVNIRKKLAEAQAALNAANAEFSLLETMHRISAQPTLAAKVEVVKPAEPPKVETVKDVVKQELVINDEWKAVLNLLHNGREHIFLTGGAGAGKSTLLEHFVEHYYGVYAILAPTGVAALRVGGQTIHSFFGFGIGPMTKDEIRELPDDRKLKFKALQTLIIDEISMVRGDLMDAIDWFLRLNRERPDKPFGGVRLLMVGDPYQLPPVAKDGKEREYLQQQYGTDTPYFFHAAVWRETALKTCALTTIFRQKDPLFTDALNAIRSGTVTPEHMKLLNARVRPGFEPPVDELWLTLTTTNNAADMANQRMLAALKTQPKTFEAVIGGEFDLKNKPTDESLILKPGLAVMFIRNNRSKGYVNGTLGKVVSVEPKLVIDAQGNEIEVDTETWENVVYEYDKNTKKLTKTVKGTFKQTPLKLAAAITIHKSQGLSLDRVIIDLANGAFASGQTYVALSRCRTLEGLVLRRPVQERDLITSLEVQAFMSGKPIAKPSGQLSLLEGLPS